MWYREVGQFSETYGQDASLIPVRPDRAALWAFLIVAAVVIPVLSLTGAAWLRIDYLIKAILIPWMVLSLASVGLNILTGFCGQISLGSAAFMAVGAYSAWNIALRVPELPLPIAILLGGVGSAIVGVGFGLPSLRIKGLYLAVSTLAAQFFVDWVFLRIHWFTNDAPSGVVIAPPIRLFGNTLVTPLELYLFTGAFVVALSLAAVNLVRGPIGRQWMAIRDMDVAAETLGIKPLFAKLSAFAVSSFFIGVAGALWAFVHLGSWDPLAFGIDQSFTILFMILIGGLGSIFGSFLGTAFILVLPIVIEQFPHAVGLNIPTATVSYLTTLSIGLLIIFLLVVEPQGFARLWSLSKERLRIWPLAFRI